MTSEWMWWPMSPPGGDGGAPPKSVLPAESSPAPMPLPIEEAEKAKQTVGKRRRGRAANILAGRLTSGHGKILLGE